MRPSNPNWLSIFPYGIDSPRCFFPQEAIVHTLNAFKAKIRQHECRRSEPILGWQVATGSEVRVTL